MSARTLIQLAICTLVWSSTWTVIRTQLGVVPVAWSVTYRFLVAAALMIVFCLVTRRSLRIPLHGHVFAAVVGLFQFVLNFNLVYVAEQSVTSGVVAAMFALLIIPNSLLAAVFLGQRITARFAVGSTLGVAGVALLFWHEIEMMSIDSSGVAFGFGLTIVAIVCASLGNVMQASPMARALPPQGMLAISLLYGALIDGIYAFVTAGPPVMDTSPLYIAGFVYLGAFASALAFNLYYDVIRTIGPARAAYSSLVIPFVAMALSTLLEGYHWTLLAAVGAGLVTLGLYVALSARRPAS